MRTAALLVVALALLLAGCGAPLSSGGTQGAPETDRIGWEDGHWHNATLDVVEDDGLNESEREAVVARAKARVESVRDLEFDGSVDVSVVSRSNFSGGASNTSDTLRRFDNGKFEALLLIGGETDSIETQSDARNQTVAGYYSPDRDALVIVSDAETPTLDRERTLAHELVHALQDQHFGLNEGDQPGTRDGHNGHNGLVEGDATLVQQRYMDRCGEAWSCLAGPATNDSDDQAAGGGGAANASGPHLGVYLLQYFPYSDGPAFVSSLRSSPNWSGVDAAYGDPPGSATEVISPERYREFEPRKIDLQDDLRAGWERVRPPDRPDSARVGQSGLAAMVGYTLYDDFNRSAVIEPGTLLNLGPGGLNQSDPINYDIPSVRGWTGDRMHVYERGGDLAYRWRLTWESAAAAERFAATYRDVLEHWGGEQTGDGHWRLPADSPFAGAFHVDVWGDTVTVAHGNTPAALADVAPAAR